MSALQPHQQRVVDEKDALDARRVGLSIFVTTSTFAGLPADERERLSRQQTVMGMYSSILADRIRAFAGA